MLCSTVCNCILPMYVCMYFVLICMKVHAMYIMSSFPQPYLNLVSTFEQEEKDKEKKKCGISDLESANFCMPNKPLLVTHPTINIQRSPFVSNDVKLNKQLQ